MINYGQDTPGVPDRGYVLYITALVMVLVASLFVGARIGTRIHTSRVGVDDATIIAALVCDLEQLLLRRWSNRWTGMLCHTDGNN